MLEKIREKIFYFYVWWRTSDKVKIRRLNKCQSKLERQRNLGFPVEKLHFLATHGYWPNFVNPKTFSEKLCAKKLYDYDERLTRIADKDLVRDFVVERLGEFGKSLLVPQLLVTSHPDEIDFSSLVGSYVIKANHASQLNYFHFDGSSLNEKHVRAKLHLWLARDFGFSRNEWAYINIPRKIVVEKMLTEKGKIPSDIKLYCFDGRIKIVKIINRSDPNNAKITNLDENLDRINIESRYTEAQDSEIPDNIEELISIAEQLSEGFDFLRVDLYSIDGQIYFGELTNYPRAGRSRIRPKELDLVMGQYWKSTQTYLPKE